MTDPKRYDETPVTFLEWLGLTDSPNFAKHRFIGGIVGVALSLLLTLALFAAVVALVRSFTAAEAGLGTGGLIVALLGAPFLIWSTVLKHQTLRYQKEGHITDRINKAVEQLGVEKTVKVPSADGDKSIERSERNIEVRIGAILSLERIAQDSTKHDKGRDHVRVMEILCAYIRENAPAAGAKASLLEKYEIETNASDPYDAPLTDTQFENKYGEEIFDLNGLISPVATKKWAQTVPTPRADIAIALRVIGRRDRQQRLAEARWGKDAKATDIWVFDIPCPALTDNDGPTTTIGLETYRRHLKAWKKELAAYRGYRLDLRGTCLQRADLSDLCLSGTNLEGARMEGANLSAARLEGANLSKSWMAGASLRDARLEGANLRAARMEGANLRAARMDGANLRAAQMAGVSLRAVRMAGTYLLDALLLGADMRGALIQGANFSKVQLAGANMRNVRIVESILTSVRMDANTDLKGAVLSKSAAKSIDLSSAGISTDQINSMFGDASVALPNNITPSDPEWPEHWPKQELSLRAFREAYTAWLATQPYPPLHHPPIRPISPP